eukprot:595381-Rhodomonas_salina.2
MARRCIALHIEMVHRVERETAPRRGGVKAYQLGPCPWDAKQPSSLNDSDMMLNNACDTQQCSTLLNNTRQH